MDLNESIFPSNQEIKVFFSIFLALLPAPAIIENFNFAKNSCLKRPKILDQIIMDSSYRTEQKFLV